jgi:hypothetical protein
VVLGSRVVVIAGNAEELHEKVAERRVCGSGVGMINGGCSESDTNQWTILVTNQRLSAMVQGKRISDDLRWAIIWMAAVLDLNTVETFTNISRHQILRIRALHRSTGDISKGPDLRTLPRSRHLSPEDVVVSIHIFTLIMSILLLE